MNISRKETWLLVFVALLAGWYVYAFTDWFRAKVIRIEYSARPLREAWTGGGRQISAPDDQLNNVSFTLHQDYRLTSVEVFRAAETNREPHPLWHLVSESGSAPVHTLSYGMPVPGMDVSVKGTTAEPLEPGVAYRLVVKAHSTRGTNDFNIPARSASR